MRVIQISPQKIALDVVFGVLPFLAAGLFCWEASPYIRGFYCNDESIRYPFLTSSVSDSMLMAFGFGVPIITIFAVETILLIYRSKKALTITAPECSYTVCSKPLHSYVVHLYYYCGIFFVGAGCTVILTTIGKFTTGRLRPHFLTVCDPDWSQISCAHDNFTYLINFACRGDPGLIREARLSFPSGHSSFSFYSMVFSVIYMQARAKFPHGNMIGRVVLQLTYISMAVYTALSRVSDYKHHWSDVLAGSTLGAIVAIIFALHVANLFGQNETKTDGTDNALVYKSRTESTDSMLAFSATAPVVSDTESSLGSITPNTSKNLLIPCPA